MFSNLFLKLLKIFQERFFLFRIDFTFVFECFFPAGIVYGSILEIPSDLMRFSNALLQLSSKDKILKNNNLSQDQYLGIAQLLSTEKWLGIAIHQRFYPM